MEWQTMEPKPPRLQLPKSQPWTLFEQAGTGLGRRRISAFPVSFLLLLVYGVGSGTLGACASPGLYTVMVQSCQLGTPAKGQPLSALSNRCPVSLVQPGHDGRSRSESCSRTPCGLSFLSSRSVAGVDYIVSMGVEQLLGPSTPQSLSAQSSASGSGESQP